MAAAGVVAPLSVCLGHIQPLLPRHVTRGHFFFTGIAPGSSSSLGILKEWPKSVVGTFPSLKFRPCFGFTMGRAEGVLGPTVKDIRDIGCLTTWQVWILDIGCG